MAARLIGQFNTLIVTRMKIILKLRALLILSLISIGTVQAAPDAVLIDFWNDSEPQSSMKIKHEAWQSILDKYLNDQHPSGINRFAYSDVTRPDRERLQSYLEYLQTQEPRQLNTTEQQAYWINLYNAYTVWLVVDRMRTDNLESIRDIRSGLFTPGPWERKRITIAAQKLSLDDIEHGILRPIFKDRRIHYVLNCASIGCPNLSKTAFSAANLEAQMVAAEKDFLSHPRAARMSGSELILSSLFDWYASDFASTTQGIIDYIKPFMDEHAAARVARRSDIDYEYDWALNRP